MSYAAKDAYVNYEVYKHIVLMRECLIKPEDVANRRNNKRKNKKKK